MTSHDASPLDITDHLGPVSYVAVEFPDGRADAAGFTALRDLVDRGLVIDLDLEFIRRGEDNALVTVPAASLDLGDDLCVFAGADAGLLDRDDLELVAGSLEGDAVMAVLLYEDLTLQQGLGAWAASGARLVAEGAVDPVELDLALDDDAVTP